MKYARIFTSKRGRCITLRAGKKGKGRIIKRHDNIQPKDQIDVYQAWNSLYDAAEAEGFRVVWDLWLD